MLKHAMSENIIARVPGQYLSQALCKLPSPETAPVERMDVTIDVPGIGLVRVTGRRMSSRKGKSRHWFWTPECVVEMNEKAPPERG